MKSGRGVRRLLAAHTVLVYLFLYAPIAILMVFSFNAARQTAFWQGFTLDWYRRLLDDGLLLRALRTSLEVAGKSPSSSARPLPWRSLIPRFAASGRRRRCSICQ